MKSLKNIDWEFYLARKNAIFYVTIYFKAHGTPLHKATGFRFINQLCTHKNEIASYYFSKTELQNALQYFLHIANNKEKIHQWQKLGKKYLKKEQLLIARFAKEIDPKTIQRQYNKIIEKCIPIFLYCTIIPYFLLIATENADRQKQKKLGHIDKLFEPFRKTTRVTLHDQVFTHIWNAAAMLTGRPASDFSYMTRDELGELFKGKQYPSRKEIEKRKNGCLFYEDATEQIHFDYKTTLLQQIPKKAEVKGTPAWQGYAKGHVCIINRYDEMNKFKDGDIIVSINSNPALLPVLAKCKAIVTDEGGMTNHAAIVARELQKPCVIGTKYATKVFKDGDLVDVDAVKGVVRKINT